MEEIRERFSKINQGSVSLKAAVAELIGAGVFIFIGTAMCCVYNYDLAHDEAGLMTSELTGAVLIGLSFGIPIAVMIYATAHVSGGQLNPAVTLSLVGAGVTPAFQGLVNIVFQVLGGVLASFLLSLVMPHAVLHGAGLGGNALPSGVHPLAAFFSEMLATGIVCYIILEVAFHPKSKAEAVGPLVIGLAFSFLIAAFFPASSGSLNPARSLGPAIMTFHFKHIWIWIFGPIAGGLLAVPLHMLSVSSIDTIVESGDDGYHVRRVGEEGVNDPILSVST